MPHSQIALKLEQLGARAKNVFFVQIGSGDGVTDDPLHAAVKSQKWGGILVEPVPYVFDRLRSNYAGQPNLTFINAAVSDTSGVTEFWYIKEPAGRNALPYWYHMIGSLDRGMILKTGAAIPDLERQLACCQVKAITLESLLAERNVEKIDVFAVDAEGSDFAILRALDVKKYRTWAIVFEHLHLADAEREECERWLVEQGYRLLREGFNTLAYLDPV